MAEKFIILMTCIFVTVIGVNGDNSEWLTNAPNSTVCLKELGGERANLEPSQMSCLLVCLGTKADWINPTDFLINLNSFKAWTRSTEMPIKEKELFINGAPFCLTAGVDSGDKCSAGKAIHECLQRVGQVR